MASRSFAGGTDEIVLGAISALDSQTEFTMICWSYLDNVTEDHGLVNNLIIGGGNNEGFNYIFDQASSAPPFDETAKFAQFGSSGSNNFWWQSFRMAASEWMCATYSWDNANEPAQTTRTRAGSTNFIIQSSEQAGTSPGPNNTGTKNNSWSYGEFGSLLNVNLKGKMAHTLLFSRAMTDEECFEYTLRPNMAHTNLQVYSPLWGRNSPEIDLSGNGNTGTLTGTAYDDDGPPVFWG